jgi:hypothetical protein
MWGIIGVFVFMWKAAVLPLRLVAWLVWSFARDMRQLAAAWAARQQKPARGRPGEDTLEHHFPARGRWE